MLVRPRAGAIWRPILLVSPLTGALFVSVWYKCFEIAEIELDLIQTGRLPPLFTDPWMTVAQFRGSDP